MRGGPGTGTQPDACSRVAAAGDLETLRRAREIAAKLAVPRPLAARLPRLEVLFDTSGEQDADLARDLARLGRGRVWPIRTYRDVAPALGELFAG
jgi:hypothetical protein